MATYEVLLERYNKVISGQSTESIKEAETVLIRLESDPLFVDINVAIICETENLIALRKFAAVYLSNYSKKIIKQRGLLKCTNTLQQYLKILKCAHLEIEIKSLIVSPIQVIITSDLGRSLKQQFATEYVRIINQAINQNDADIDFMFIVFCGLSLFVRDGFDQQTKQIIKASMQALIKLMIRLIVRVSGENILQNGEKSLLLLRIIKQFALLLRQYFKRLAILDIQCTKILYLQELASLITLALNFNYKQNEIESSLYVSIPGEELISKIINIIKTNFFVVITNFIRLTHTFTKHVNLYASNPLFLKIPQILAYSIRSTSSLLQRVPFYQLPHKIMIMETLDEVLNFYISCLRVVSFYQTFCDSKMELIENIILPCLSLTPQDIENFYEDSLQFIQNTLQIVGRDLRIPNGSIQSEDPEDQIKQFETLRTLSAEFLSSFCKFQDGTLTHVIEYAISILNGSQGSKSLMFLIICILSIHFKDRKDLRIKITRTIYELLKNTAIPIMTGNKKQEDIEYAYLLLTLSKIYFFAMDQKPDIINLSYKVGISIIQSPSVNQVHKYFVFDIFNNLARTQQASQYVQDLLTIYNHLLKTMQQPSIHLLDSYFTLIKFNTEQLKAIPGFLLETLKYVCLHIQQQVQKPQPTKILLCKYWNIVRQVGQCDDFIPNLIEPIEQLIVPLLPYIDGKRDLDYEEDILMLLTSFIEKSKRVTVSQQKMFEIIPRIFYNQYNYRFGHSFHAIQLFIYYGKDILCQNYAAIQSIIDMSLVSITTLQHNKKPINETQNCQGALVLQSLILKCGEVFNINSWKKTIDVVKNRLFKGVQIRFRHFKSNLYALLSLCFIHSFKYFPNEENEILLSKILQQLRVYNKIQYSPKVVIAGLTELLLLSECEFVGRRFTQILDTVITMLEITAVKKEDLFDDDEADEQKQYANALIMLKNDLKGLDQFTFFRQQVEKLKLKNLPLLQKSVGELPKSKKDFFMHILRIERVANEPRQIYKIKR